MVPFIQVPRFIINKNSNSTANSQRRGSFWVCMMMALAVVWLPIQSFAADQSLFEESLELFKEKSFSKKEKAVQLLADSEHEAAVYMLKQLQDGNLYLHKKTDQLVVAEKGGKGYLISDAISQEDLGEVGRRDVKKVSINNRLRGAIKGSLAILTMANPDPKVRSAALDEVMSDLDPDMRPLLEKRKGLETEANLQEKINVALASLDLKSADASVRLQAVKALGSSLYPTVRNRLHIVAESDPDATVKRAAEKSLEKIESKVEMYGHMETLFFGLSLGSVLVLAAIGLAITFGVMGVINMAHGELIMLGAYTTYVIQLLMPNHIEYSLIVAVPAAFIVSGLVGIAIERGVIRFLYGRPLETLLATFGISLILQQAVRSIFSPLNRSVETPAWMSGALEINSIFSLTYNRLYIIVFCLFVFAALFLVLKKTPLGLQVRAVSQNRTMARAMGVRTQWVDALTFGLGSGIAGVAGVALSQLTNVGPNLGQAYIIDSFMVVVFGGVGNLWGTLVAGLSLGVANKIMEPWAGAVLAKILVLVFIILFIQKRPRGLFPQKGRAAEG